MQVSLGEITEERDTKGERTDLGAQNTHSQQKLLHTPGVPEAQKAKEHLSPGVQEQPWQHRTAPSLNKFINRNN